MKKGHMPDSHTSHPNVTPLIDIVMCLIIFYMLVAKIGISTGADTKIKVPPSLIGTDIKDMGNTLFVNVRRGLGTLPNITGLIKRPNGQSEVVPLLLTPTPGGDMLSDVLAYYRKGKPNFKVIIRGEEDMTYQYLEPVLIACAQADVQSVAFQTQKITQRQGE